MYFFLESLFRDLMRTLCNISWARSQLLLIFCWSRVDLLLLCESLRRVWLFVTLWTVTHQAPLSMGFSRQKYWSGLPFPSPRYLPDPGIEPRSPALQADSLSSSAASAAKSLQLCLTLCDPIDVSPPGFPIPGILQARTLEWVAISFSSAWKWRVKVKSLSCIQLLATPWTAAHQAAPSMGFFWQEYWSGFPLPSLLSSEL